MLYTAKVILLALAGLGYIAGAFWRWRSLDQNEKSGLNPWALVTGAFVCHAVAAALAIGFTQHADLVFAVCGSIGAALIMLFSARLMGMKTPGLLLMPVGIVVLLVAIAAIIDRPLAHPENDTTELTERSWSFGAHMVFMSANLAASLFCGASAALYLAASRQLKQANRRALRLPGLPLLLSATEKSLLISLAMLLGGFISGGVAIGPDSPFTILHPTVIIAFLTLLLMILTVVARASRRLPASGLAWMCLLILLLDALIVVVLMVVEPHG